MSKPVFLVSETNWAVQPQEMAWLEIRGFVLSMN